MNPQKGGIDLLPFPNEMNYGKGMDRFIPFFVTVSPLYPQDKRERGISSETKQEDDERSSIGKGGELPVLQQDFINPSVEVYSPYLSNLIIPKGVCEKSEPVLIIDNKK